MILNDEFRRIWEEMAYFKILSIFLEGLKEKHEDKPQ
jgi:hypothetical protein